MYAGISSERMNSIAEVWLPLAQTCWPNNTAGRSEVTKMSASRSISAGSPIDFVEER